MSVLSPDCRDGNHGKCYGDAWDPDEDQGTDCQCDCHASPSGNGEAANWADVGRAITRGIAEGLATQPPSRAERQHPPVDPSRVRFPEAVASPAPGGSTLWTRPGSGRTWWT